MTNGATWTVQIVESIQRGVNVEASCEALFNHYYRTVVGFFLRRGFNTEDSRDLAQETFFKAFNNIQDLESPESFSAWLMAIATNTYKNEVRSRLAFKRGTDRVLVSTQDVPIDTVAAGNPYEPTIHDNLVSQEQAENLERALEELPPQNRRCMLLRFGQGLKYREIADVMQISIGTVKSHIHEARKQLKKKMGG